MTLHPQYIKDANGKESMVILPAVEFETIIDELEALDDVKLYDDAKNEDNGERFLLTDYIKNRKLKNA